MLATLLGVKMGEVGSDCSRIQRGSSHPSRRGIEKRLR
jgi:hypothetical protein